MCNLAICCFNLYIVSFVKMGFNCITIYSTYINSSLCIYSIIFDKNLSISKKCYRMYSLAAYWVGMLSWQYAKHVKYHFKALLNYSFVLSYYQLENKGANLSCCASNGTFMIMLFVWISFIIYKYICMCLVLLPCSCRVWS